MQVLCLTHVTFEGPARIASWAINRGHRLSVARSDQIEAWPDPELVDLLVVMGGPMSANDALAWMRRETLFLEQAMRLKKPVLGVCLGAQLLAKIHGARVYRALQGEIGWWPVRSVQLNDLSAPCLPRSFIPLHWHGETFDLPRGSIHLAETDSVPNQAFLLDEQVVGLQFHIEATPESVAAIVEGARADLTGASGQQSVENIVGQCEVQCEALESPCYALLDWLVQRKPA
jgi:GMP synthase-like glutamine amidotransferase